MLPREFVARYGFPKYRILSSVTAGQMICDRDVDRYALMVYVNAGPVVMVPHEQFAVSAVGVNITADIPLDIAYSRHGSLVCDAWFIGSVGIGVNLLVCEGRADPTNQLVIYEPGRVGEVVRREPRGDVYSGIGSLFAQQPQAAIADVIARRGDDVLDRLPAGRGYRPRGRRVGRRDSTLDTALRRFRGGVDGND